MVKINGELREHSGRTVSEMLEIEGYSSQRVAVELNERIVPKAEYDTTVLSDDDVVEVVSFVGGG